METRKSVIIVGGVAGGASCAARVRRLDESAYVTVFDRGPFVSFANCGLPYFVGDIIQDEGKLLVASPKLFRNRFNIDVQTHHDVVSINCQSQEELFQPCKQPHGFPRVPVANSPSVQHAGHITATPRRTPLS
jgi:hypothetical protein